MEKQLKPFYAGSVQNLPDCVNLNPCSTMTCQDMQDITFCGALSRYNSFNVELRVKDSQELLDAYFAKILNWSKSHYSLVLIQSYTEVSVKFTFVSSLSLTLMLKYFRAFLNRNKYIDSHLHF